MQVNIVQVVIVLVQLHMNHLLALLVKFVLLEVLVDLAHFVLDLALVLDRHNLLNLGARGVHYLVVLHFFRRLVAQVQIDDGATDLN